MKSFTEAINESSANSATLAQSIKDAMEKIHAEMSYKDFAAAVAKVLQDDYGDHNYKPFMDELKKML